jgi:hypothetical protein
MYRDLHPEVSDIFMRSSQRGSWYHTAITGRLARRLSFTCFLVFLFVIAAAHIRNYFLVKTIEGVLAGLQRVRLDQTTETELLTDVPLLTRRGQDRRVDSGLERRYGVVISNEHDWLLGGPLYPAPAGWRYELEDLLGYRTLIFAAGVLLRDGKVSHIGYEVEQRADIWPRHAGAIVSAESAHGFWNPSGSVIVTSEDDESPQFRVYGDEKFLGVTYASDASSELSSLAFRIDLSCFWALRSRCHSTFQVAPLWWQRKRAVEDEALARLTGPDPCPDRILAARIRYYPDTNAELLDVVRSRTIAITDEGSATGDETLTDYRLRSTLRGKPTKALNNVRYNPFIPSPADSGVGILNPIPAFRKAGEGVLLLSGSSFESCRMVPATPSAISAVRTAVPASKYREDLTPKLFR